MNEVTTSLYNAVVTQVHRCYFGVAEYTAAYEDYVRQARAVIHRDQGLRARPGEMANTPPQPAGAKPDVEAQLASALHQMPPANRLEFVAELTGAWCLLCPPEKAGRQNVGGSFFDLELAERRLAWLLMPYDFFK